MKFLAALVLVASLSLSFDEARAVEAIKLSTLETFQSETSLCAFIKSKWRPGKLTGKNKSLFLPYGRLVKQLGLKVKVAKASERKKLKKKLAKTKLLFAQGSAECAKGPPDALPKLALSQLVSGLDNPVYLTHAGDTRVFVVEQGGRIKVVKDGTLQPTPFLDIAARISSGGERGLLSVAFHPQYQSNGRLFVNYTDTNGDTVVSEFAVSGDQELSDANSERIILQVEQPFANHNGGQIQFGPDGFLYIGMGDGGSGGDPLEHGQNLGTLLGAMLRIDVNGSQPYAVPTDNPFITTPGSRAEIWAYGFRNPWRFSFDRLTGALFAGDVGQNKWEEVDIVTKGANYGWNVMEGEHCFKPAENCATAGLILPIAEYDHDEGASVTGGYVYRGTAIPTLQGRYIFGDFGSGTIWALTQQPNGTWKREVALNTAFNISSFGEDQSGELYVVDFGGQVLKVVPQ